MKISPETEQPLNVAGLNTSSIVEGRNEGRREGRKEGREEGRKEGGKEGRKERIYLTKRQCIIHIYQNRMARILSLRLTHSR